MTILRVLVTCLLLPLGIVAQAVHNGDLQVLGVFDASVGTASKPMPTVTTDPTGACIAPNAMVLNSSTGTQKGHISACVGGAWNLLNGASGVTNLRTNVTGSGIGPWPFTPSTTDTLRVWDNTPSTGVTVVTLQAGPNQGVNNTLQVQDASGTTQSSLAWSGGYPFWLTFAPTNVTTFATYGVSATGDAVPRVKIGLDSGTPFVSMGSGAGAVDVGLERSAPQQISVTQGQSFGFLGDLQARKLTAGSLSAKGSTSGSVTLQAPSAPASYTWTFPSADGSGAVTSNGSGILAITPLAASATTDATNAGNISSGVLSASRLPSSITSNTTGNAATATALAAAPTGCSAGQYATGVSASGNATCAALAASATTDTTNAANITSGTLPSGRLPNPSASTLGGVESIAAISHSWVNSISTGGAPALSQPAFSDLSGTATNAQLPLSTFDVFWPAGTCTASATPSLGWDAPASGAEATAAGCSGTNVNQAYASFSNSGTPALLRSFMLPPDFSSTNGANVYINYLTATASGTFTIALDVSCTPGNGTATNDPAFTANNFFAPGSQTAPAVASELQTLSVTNIAWPAACTANASAHFRLIRTDTTGTATSVLITGVTLVGRRTL